MIVSSRFEGLLIQEMETIIDHEHQLLDYMCERKYKLKFQWTIEVMKSQPNWVEWIKKKM